MRTAALLLGTQVVGTLVAVGLIAAGSASGGARAGEMAAQTAIGGAGRARVPAGGEPRAVSSVLDRAGHALEPVYGFRSLLAFKAKFQPRYEPLFLTYPDPVALPAIGVAVGRAYLPDLTARQSARLVARMRERPTAG